MRSAWQIAVVALIAGVAPALAEGQPQREWPSASQRWLPQNPPCTCRAQGRDFLLGEIVCLRTVSGDRLATCGMALNNTTWTIADSPCTVSAAPTQ